jgi:SagB-type dehydrogenase family enzyme
VNADTAPSVVLADLLYGSGSLLDDPAEAYHEASRLHPETAYAELPGLQLLAAEPAVALSTTRAGRRRLHRPRVELDAVEPGPVSLAEALERRCSALPATVDRLPLSSLGTILAAAQRSLPRDGVQRRPAPSAGALYPLELYVAALQVDGLESGLMHYDPYSHCLVRLGDLDGSAVAATLPDRSLLDRAACALVLTAVFWRSRFKYGQRGYRFVLLEAGHVAQNAVLAAAALAVPALPLGGFYDTQLDALLDLDGVDESALYVLLLGGNGA